MSHTCMSHATRSMNESCPKPVWVMRHMRVVHVTHMNGLYHAYECVLSRTCERAMAHMMMSKSHVTRGNESRRECKCCFILWFRSDELTINYIHMYTYIFICIYIYIIHICTYIHMCICTYIYQYIYRYIYICTYIIYVCICMLIYAYIHIYLYIYKYIYIHIYIHKYIYTFRCIHIHTYVCICLYLYIYVYVYIHTYTFMYIYIHIYIRICEKRNWFVSNASHMKRPQVRGFWRDIYLAIKATLS